MRLHALPVIALLYVAGFVLNLLYGICGSIGVILAGLGGFAAFLALLDGSYAHCGTVTVPICSTDAAITGRKRFDCRCISTICLVFLKTKHDDKTAVGYTAVFPFQIAFKKP